MVQYLAKRIGRSLLTLFIIVTLVFCLLRLMPVEGYFSNYEKMTEAQIQAWPKAPRRKTSVPRSSIFRKS